MSANDVPFEAYKLRDAAERLAWTAGAAAVGAIATKVLRVPRRHQLAAAAVLTTAAGAGAIAARHRLKFLPDPGAAVAEEVATEVYRQVEVGYDGNLDIENLVAQIEKLFSNLNVVPATAVRSIVTRALSGEVVFP